MAISPPIRIWCGGRCAIRRNVSRQELGKTNGNIPSIISINAIASSNDAAISIQLKAPRLFAANVSLTLTRNCEAANELKQQPAGHVVYRDAIKPIVLLLAWGRCATSQLRFPAPFACR